MIAGRHGCMDEWVKDNVHRVWNEEWLYFTSLGGVSNPPQIISFELHWSSHSVHQSFCQSVMMQPMCYQLQSIRWPQTRILSGATIPLPLSLLCIGQIGLVGCRWEFLLTLRALGWAFLPSLGKWRAHLLGCTSSGRRGNGCLVWSLGDQPIKRGWACVIGRDVFWCLRCLFTY